MDPSRHRELKTAPQVVFDHPRAWNTLPRFMILEQGDWKAITWRAYAAAIRDLACFLHAEGLGSGERAAIFAPNRVEWIEAALGIQAAGGVLVPVYPSSTPEQAAYVIEHSGARVLFVDEAPLLEKVLVSWSRYTRVERIVLLDDGLSPLAVAEAAREKGLDVPPLEELERKVTTWSRARALGSARDREDPASFERILAATSLDHGAVMIYTSGTTGNPKGVPLTHRNIAHNTRDWLESLAPLLDEGYVDLHWLPMSHIFGLGEVSIGNQLGWVSYLTTPQAALELLPMVRPQVFMSVPSYWEKLAGRAVGSFFDERDGAEKFRRATGGALRLCLSGGGGLKPEIKEHFHRAGLLLIEGYGLTETSPTLTLNRPDAFRFDSVGKPLPSVQLRLADDGEILAKGPNVFSGYHEDPEATLQAFTEDGWFKTGDIGRFTEDGFLQIVDRKKEILVTAGGKNIPPANIEQRFRDDSLLAHVVVYGDGKHYLVAGVWVNQAALDDAAATGEAQPEALRQRVQAAIDRVNSTLASFETIKKFVIIDEPLTVENGLLTPTLKLKRKKIYQTFERELEALYT